ENLFACENNRGILAEKGGRGRMAICWSEGLLASCPCGAKSNYGFPAAFLMATTGLLFLPQIKECDKIGD
ncbi:hypothetical protein, partial [Aeromonas jandaei]|uniref:hypothetical protein n=1 Tax=Aeromonas jandaei TaxID=650 RepID=UPI002B054DEA